MKLPIVFLVKNMPVDRLPGVPLPMHGELTPLESSFFPGCPNMNPRNARTLANCSNCPRHLFKQTSFPMNDFVVRYDQHNFRKRVHESKVSWF